MPTFTTIAFDKLLETRSPESLDGTVNNPMPTPHSKPPLPRPASNSKLERRHSTSSAERRSRRPQMTPALYATPEATPLPDAPSSFSPSPYVIDHKRHGPRLVKSSSETGMSSLEKLRGEERGNGDGKDGENCSTDSRMVQEKNMDSVNDVAVGKPNMETEYSRVLEVGGGSSSDDFVEKTDTPKPETLVSVKMVDNIELYEPQESLSRKSNTEEEEDSSRRDQFPNISSAGEFFDAWEELSSESGQQQQQQQLLPSSGDAEKELREMRLSLLMEIEKWKQTEEALTNLQGHWQRLREGLSLVGLALPQHPNPNPNPNPNMELESSEQLGVVVGPPAVNDLCQQVVVARFVSKALGRATANAEMEAVMEDEIEAKNFEIARLIDRLHYYETVNREMSQMNQEAVERTRRLWQRRKRRQRWIWGSVAAAVSLGGAALLGSYYPVGKASSSTSAITQELKQSSESEV